MSRPQHAPGAMIARAFSQAPRPEQLPLAPRRELLSRYEVGAPFAPRSDSSREAAESIVSLSANLRLRVLRSLVVADGATAQQLETLTGLSGNTVRPRLIELVTRGLVIKTDEKRETHSGRSANVYRATDNGRDAMAGSGGA